MCGPIIYVHRLILASGAPVATVCVGLELKLLHAQLECRLAISRLGRPYNQTKATTIHKNGQA